MGYCEILDNKTADNVVLALTHFMAKTTQLHIPVSNIYFDQGSEFLNYKVQDFFTLQQEGKIEFGYNDVDDKNKMGKIERFNRTIKDKLLPLLVGQYQINKHYQNIRGVTIEQCKEILKVVVERYNDTVHSSINMSPNTFIANYAHNHNLEWRKQKTRQQKVMNKMEDKHLPIGSWVKIAYTKREILFSKLEKQKYREGIFQISDVNKNKGSLKNKNHSILK